MGGAVALETGLHRGWPQELQARSPRGPRPARQEEEFAEGLDSDKRRNADHSDAREANTLEEGAVQGGGPRASTSNTAPRATISSGSSAGFWTDDDWHSLGTGTDQAPNPEAEDLEVGSECERSRKAGQRALEPEGAGGNGLAR